MMESTLSSPFSRSSSSVSHQGAVLALLEFLLPHDLVLWTDGSAPFPFGKGGSGVLVICSFSVTLRPLFPFQQAQYVQVFLLKPTPFCTLFAGLGNTNKSATSLLFSFYLALVLSSPPCPLLHRSFYLKLCGRSGRNCLLSSLVLSGYNRSPDTRFVASGERMPDREWVRLERSAKNPGIREEEVELRLDSWIQIRSTGWDERKWK